MKKLIHIDDHSGELICDSPTCDYIAPAGLHKWGPHLIGLPCPKCDESLLTQQDFDKQQEVFAEIARINAEADALGIGSEEAPRKGDPGVRSVRVHHHAGQTTVENTDE